MSNIDYQGAPKHPMPSKRYDIFITAFEKVVAEKQKEIAAIDGLMRPYEIVRQALERAKLPNDASIYLLPGKIKVDIPLQDTDGMAVFVPLLKDIGQELVLARLRLKETPMMEQSAFRRIFTWKLIKMDNVPSVEVHLCVPYNGTEKVKITTQQVPISYVDTRYSSTWLDEVTLHDTEEVQTW